MSFHHTLLFCALASLFGGCGLFGSKDEPPPPPAPTRVELTIEAEGDICPDSEGRASPLLLRIYELKDISNFKGADFFALYDREQTALAGDLARKQEFLKKPGEQRELILMPEPDAQFIGLFAGFRQLDTAQWRASAPLAPHRTSAVQVRIGGTRLTLAVPEATPAQPQE